jgi:hypothetical protein
MGFLYFPEDKTEYIPAVFTLILFVIGAILITKIIRNVSHKQQRQFEEQYRDKLLNQKDENK